MDEKEEKLKKLKKIFIHLEEFTHAISDYYDGVKVAFLPLPPPPEHLTGISVFIRDPETNEGKYVFLSIDILEEEQKVMLKVIEYTEFVRNQLKKFEMKKKGFEVLGEMVKKKEQEEKQKHYT